MEPRTHGLINSLANEQRKENRMEREPYSLSAVEFEGEAQEMAGAYVRGILSKSEYDDWRSAWTRDTTGDFINAMAVLQALACENVAEDPHTAEELEEESDGMCLADFGEGFLACLSGVERDEYLTISELAERLKVKPKTIRNKISSQVFKCGVHYYRPPGLGPRFKWSAIKVWLESEQSATTEAYDDADEIPMARGYALGRGAAVAQPGA